MSENTNDQRPQQPTGLRVTDEIDDQPPVSYPLTALQQGGKTGHLNPLALPGAVAGDDPAGETYPGSLESDRMRNRASAEAQRRMQRIREDDEAHLAVHEAKAELLAAELDLMLLPAANSHDEECRREQVQDRLRRAAIAVKQAELRQVTVSVRRMRERIEMSSASSA